MHGIEGSPRSWVLVLGFKPSSCVSCLMTLLWDNGTTFCSVGGYMRPFCMCILVESGPRPGNDLLSTIFTSATEFFSNLL